ncbi:hypothetical protein [Photobacterium rosenbergii]|uniref:LysR substrate-binding domain-containing protein n=1 Tax=Photobacterium rosenbergii TaxID=294936 RepID=A0ABU3ZER7_9GAMM|nr:hypothetical protein [Photobacterium rosenbergii]MDV5168576.1 hypothetical protein [Photobacterium rosenbergii]
MTNTKTRIKHTEEFKELALKQSPCSGHGIALLPDLFVKGELKSGELIEVLPMWQADKHSLYLVYPFHKGNNKSQSTYY